MADTTALVVLELYEWWKHTGDADFVRTRWANATRAIRWCIGNAKGDDDFGLPQYLTNTYDHFGSEGHRAVAYNAFIYMSAMRACSSLAVAMGDAVIAAACNAALASASEAIVDPTLLWNTTHGFFRAHTDVAWHTYVKQSMRHAVGAASSGAGAAASYEHRLGWLATGNGWVLNASAASCRAACSANSSCAAYCFESDDANPAQTVRCFLKTKIQFTPYVAAKEQVFTDTLYGEMLSHHHFDGTFTLNTSYLHRHLAFELAANNDTYGMRVLSNPVQEDSIWMNGPPTWSYLQLALGKLPAEDALAPLRRMSENFRSRLRDMWNLRALTHTDGSLQPAETNKTIELGAPREQGHYGFMLTDLYLLPLLSGLNVDLPHGRLSLSPKFAPPYVLPVLIAGMEGSLTSLAKGSYELKVAFGRLQLPASPGLVVDGVSYGVAVDLRAGQSVAWKVPAVA